MARSSRPRWKAARWRAALACCLLAFAAAGGSAAESRRATAKGGAPVADAPLNQRMLAQQQPVSAAPYDSHPVLVEGAGGGFIAWHSFVPGAERIVGRPLRGRADVPFVDVSAGSGVFTPPELASGGDGELAFAWSTFKDGRWAVVGRRHAGGKWDTVVAISPAGAEAVFPTLGSLGRERFAVAWVQWSGEHFEIVWATWDARGIGAPSRVSDVQSDAFRPQFVTGDGGTLDLVWDAAANNSSRVYARRLLPALGAIEPVSQSRDRCLKPVAARTSDGKLIVAWIRATDVVGGDGAIDQMHAVELAQRDAAGWHPILNEHGGSEAAWLTHGLLAQIEPKPVPTGGYLGRRRDPMFVREADATWLVWERKALQEGSTTTVTGELLGRRIAGGDIGPTVLLAKGAVDYHVAHDAHAQAGKFSVIASSLPRDGQRNYSLATVQLADAQPAKTEAWAGWKRIELPAPEAEPRRHVLQENGREYRLFWMDSHVHSALSADAEGEPDEILLYARDRGRLDTVVMQENDFFNCPLTDWEYALGGFYSRAFSRDGKFVALPGYEWTQRLPVDRTQPINQPRFWSASNPNHRTVIYPRAGGPLVRYTDAGNDIRRLYEVVAKHGGVMHTQHPDFEFTGAAGEVAIEVTAGWGLYFLNPGKIHATLNRGFRAGFVGTSDSHRRNPGLGGGLTGIYATELTPDALLEAYRARRVFATSGARIAVEARANGVLMGGEVAARRNAKLTVFVGGSRPIRRATLVRDGVDVKVFAAAGDATNANFEYEAVESEPGTHWFYWRVEQEGVSRHYGGNVSTAFGNLAWSTPHWITFK
ncbi:MAG: DUF3604 domain-containing protein [Opitutaceae bacterium]|nr:DUF3604 domain-containing protein [Opitutaceae bacterium]